MSSGVCTECGSPLDHRDRCNICQPDSEESIGLGWADIEANLNHLPEEEREVLMLRIRTDEDGMFQLLSVRDIANKLRKTPEEVRSLERSAVNRLNRGPVQGNS